MCEAAGPRPPALGAGGEAGTGLRRRSYTVAIYTPPQHGSAVGVKIFEEPRFAQKQVSVFLYPESG